MTYYHGTTNRRFRPGEIIKPGREVGAWSNWTVFEENLTRRLESGRVVHPNEVVWVTGSQEEAADWAAHSTLKAGQAEIRQMPAGGLAVYEVEPIDLDRPVEQHSRDEVEWCCARARVVREVSFEPFEQDLCDACGEPATVGLGSDEQLCGACAAEPSWRSA